MVRQVTVNAVDRSDVTRYPGTNLISAGFNGEPGTGAVIVDDVAAALAFPSLKIVRWTEDASGATKHLYRGRVIRKGLDRGGDVADDARQFTIDVSDSNWDLRRLRVHQWSRPAETGRARVVALGAYILNGSSSTVTNANKRPSTDIDVTTYVPNTNTSVMDARVYDATDPWAVIDDCARAEGKVFFVFTDDAGDMLLWYDVGTSTSYASTLSITDDAPNLTTEFGPAPDGSPGEEDGSELLSGGALVPAGGILSIVAESRPAIVTAHDVAEETFYDSGADSDAATRLGFFLDAREDEEFRYSCSVDLPDDKAHLIKAGMTISFRWAAAGVTTPIVQRVVRCGLELVEPDLYTLHLELGFPEKLAGRIRDVGRGVIVSTPPTIHCIETFTRTLSDSWGTSEFGTSWQSETVLGSSSISVDGDEGVLAVGPPQDFASVYMWADVWPSGMTLPVEILWRFTLRWNYLGKEWSLGLQLDSPPNPLAPVIWAYLGLNVFNYGSVGSRSYDLEAWLDASFGDSANVVIATWTGVPDATIVTEEFYARVRLEDAAFRGKVWKVTDSEPGPWSFQDTTLGTPGLDGQSVSLGIGAGGLVEDTDKHSSFKFNNIQIIEGCHMAATDVQTAIAASVSSFVTASKWSLE